MNSQLLAGGGVPNTITNPLFKGSIFDAMVSTEDGGYIFIGTVLPNIVGLVIIFGIVSFFLIFLSGAVSWILSGGDKAHVESAKAKLTNALVGIILLFSSIAIIKLVEYFFGINILTIDIGPLVIQ